MSDSSPRIRSLLRQADRVTASGKRLAAENLYRQILEEAPDTAPAWVGLAKVVQDSAEQEAALERALVLDPENAEAKIGLTAVRNGQSVVEALNPEPEPVREAAPPKQPQPEPAAKAAPLNAAPVPAATAEATLKAAEQGLDDHLDGAVVTEEALYCINHPNRLTHLRCNKCGRPVCAKCVRPTPVGYRCKSCIREHEDVFYTASLVDYLIAAVVGYPLGVVAGYFVGLFSGGFLGILVIFYAAFVGSLIARIVHRVVGRRRGRWMPYLVASAVVIGGILPALPALLGFISGEFAFGAFRLIFLGLYIVIATSAAFYQMK